MPLPIYLTERSTGHVWWVRLPSFRQSAITRWGRLRGREAQ